LVQQLKSFRNCQVRSDSVTMFRDPKKKMSTKKEMIVQCGIGSIGAAVSSFVLPGLFAKVK